MIKLERMSASDIDNILDAFHHHNWAKPRGTFETYLRDQEKGTRLCWVCYQESDVAGYITLNLSSKYAPFAEKNTPEIQDLNVLPPYRNQGLGTALLDIAEKKAAETSELVGIGVGLYKDYGAAQRLYSQRGYLPDGRGVTYNYETTIPGQSYPLDDDLVLWFRKKF